MSDSSESGYDIDPLNLSKRRSAILSLLSNTRLSPRAHEHVRSMAVDLSHRCRVNDHPLCSIAIDLGISGVIVDFKDLLKHYEKS